MTLHVISDLQRDLQAFKARLMTGDMSPEQARTWFARLDERVADVECYLDAGTEQLVLTDIRRSPGWVARWTPAQPAQPGRRTRTSGRLSIVDGGRP